MQDVVTKEVHQSAYATLSSLTPISYNCIDNSCVDPLDGTGIYTSLASCEAACNNTTSIEEINKSQLMFPNPASETIYIPQLKENTTVKIFDLSGRLVLEIEGLDKKHINISSLSAGTYQVQLECIDSIETRKLIKQ